MCLSVCADGKVAAPAPPGRGSRRRGGTPPGPPGSAVGAAPRAPDRGRKRQRSAALSRPRDGRRWAAARGVPAGLRVGLLL